MQVALWIVDVDGSLVQTDPSFIQVEVKNSEECALEESNHPYTLCTVALTGKILVLYRFEVLIPVIALKSLMNHQI